MPLRRILLWLLLALPAGLMVQGVASGTDLPMDVLHPSGEMAVRLMVLAMLPGPLSEVFGVTPFFQNWLSIRRNLGVAAFGYAVLHLLFYVIDMGTLRAILDELTLPAIWTGWLGLALLIPPAAISMDRAMRALGRRWLQIQRLVYPALLLSLLHWLLLDWAWQPALVHGLPLMAVWTLRGLHRRRVATKRSLA